FVDAYVDAMCANLGRCCAQNSLPFSLDGCKANARDTAQQLLDQHTATPDVGAFDESHAGRCVQLLSRSVTSCTYTSREERYLSDACAHLFSGSRDLGDSCVADVQCLTQPDRITSCLPHLEVVDGGLGGAAWCRAQASSAAVGDICDTEDP